MKIGFDASFLEQKTTGAGQYLRNLSAALATQLDNDVRFYLPQDITIAGLNKAKIAHMPWKSVQGSVVRMVLGTVAWPYVTYKDELDIFHVPNYFLPYGIFKPTVITIYDLRAMRYPETYQKSRLRFLRSVIPETIRRATRIITISEFTKRELIELFNVNEECIDVTHLAADSSFRVINAQEILADVGHRYQLPQKFILAVGYIEPRRNFARLVEALSFLRKQGCEHKLVIAGPRYLVNPELEHVISQLQMEQYVHFTGYVEDKDLPALYNLADIFVNPSLYEGFGIPVLEAMACGTPVIASNTTSFPEVVGNAGILIDPLDTKQIADAIAKILHDSKFAQQLIQLGFINTKQFTWERTAHVTTKVYQKVVNGA